MLPGAQLPHYDRAAMADDPIDGFALYFGGEDLYGNAQALTMAFRAGTWYNLSANLSSAPPPRWGAAMAYDPTAHAVILFGGCPDSTCVPQLADTWSFANGTWSDLSASAGTAPGARGSPGLAWDSTGNRLVLFGGMSETSTQARFLGDTWTFAAGRWSNDSANVTASHPPPRSEASESSVPSGGVVLFGGEGPLVADTWTFANGTWTNVTSSAGTGPTARHGAAMASDPAAGYALLIGGYEGGQYPNDSWSFESGRWSSRSFAYPDPTPVYVPAMTFDSTDQELVVQGGEVPAGYVNGAWTLSGGTWTLENPAPGPPPRPPPDLLIPEIQLAVLPVVLVVSVGAGHVARVRRERALRDLFPSPSASDVQWTPTQDRSRLARPIVRMGLVLSGVTVGMSLLLVGIVLSGPAVDLAFDALLMGTMLAVLIGLPVSIVLAQLRFLPTTVGVCSSGVIVQRRAGEARVPWGYLSPPETASRTNGAVGFRYAFPSGQARGFLTVDQNQARAILAHPAASAWQILEPVRLALGLPSRTPGAPGAPAPFAVGPGGAGPSAGPLPGAPLPSSGSPGAPRTAAPPVAARTGTPRPYGSPPGASLPSFRGAQLQRCRGCGALQAISATYCSRCGQVLGGPT